MRLFRCPAGWLASLLLATAASARAETQADALRLIPAKADFFFKVEQPRKLVDLVYALDLFKQLQQIDPIREFYDSTNARRFYQLVAYFEKQLGMKWPKMLERLGSGGAVIAVRFGGSPAPFVLVIQGKDDKLLDKFFTLALQVADQELARQEIKDRLVKGRHRAIETVQINTQFHVARAGSALVLSNHADAFKQALDQYLDGGKGSVAELAGVKAARKLLPAHPLAWAWVNLETIHRFPQAKEFLAEKQNNAILTVGIGSYLDLIRRSPYACAGVYQQRNNLVTTIRLPRGWQGMPEKWTAYLSSTDQGGTLPLLEPKNVLYSASSYADIAQFWHKRAQFFNESQVKTFEQFDKNSGRFLAGAKVSKLLAAAGPHQRFVLVQQTSTGYKTRPAQLFPSGAFIVDMRDPDEFSKSMDTILRGIALLGGGQLNLKLVEGKKGNHTIVGYRFPEATDKITGPLRNDVNNVRYNFSPCFVRVGNQFVISSTIELAGELVDLLDKEAKDTNRNGKPDVSRSQVYAAGGAAVMRVFKDQLVTQTILGQAVATEKAETQVKMLTDLVSRLGVLEFAQKYSQDLFQFDIRWKFGQ
jgi:hypothetical protein